MSRAHGLRSGFIHSHRAASSILIYLQEQELSSIFLSFILVFRLGENVRMTICALRFSILMFTVTERSPDSSFRENVEPVLLTVPVPTSQLLSQRVNR